MIGARHVPLALVLLASGAAAQVAPGESVSDYRAWAWPGRAALAPDVRPDTLDASPPDLWIARDKALHLGGSFLLTLSGQYVLEGKAEWDRGDALPLAAGAALALGLAKELADSRGGRHPLFSTRDLVADALGVALAAGVVLW